MTQNTGIILGIETSCDETAVAVVANGHQVLSNVIASQYDLHREYKGVVPEIASRAHAQRLLPVLRKTLAEAKLTLKDIDAIAVGHRPGLIGSLLVGVSSAKALAWSLGIPFIGVDHIHAHLHAGCLDSQCVEWPALGLVVSGGHTSLFRCESPTNIKRLGKTIDDAVGEAFDKVATILGLEYPGGPHIDTLAQSGDEKSYDFPVSRLDKESLDFSFSGLKTSVLYTVRGTPDTKQQKNKKESTKRQKPDLNDRQQLADLSASFQRAAVDAILVKLERAYQMNPDCLSVLVGGGVSANTKLRQDLLWFSQATGLDITLPKSEYCMDNAAMIAGLGWYILKEHNWVGDPLTLTADAASAY